MFRATSYLLVLLTLALAAPATAHGQERRAAADVAAQARLLAADSTKTFIVRTRDGSSLSGRVLAVRNDTLSFATDLGTLALPVGNIVAAVEVRPEDIHGGVYWFPNPNTTRLLFAPTGRMLEKGEGYFSDYMLFLPGVAVGITDRVTIGGGISIIPGVGFDEQLFYLTPKVGIISRPRFNLAAGALVMQLGLGSGEGSSNSAGILYSVGTFGGDNGSVTAGLGFGYAGGTLAKEPAVMLGGDVRTSRRFGLVTENYFFPGLSENALISGGGRFFGEKMAVDFGLVTAVGSGGGGVAPFVGFVVNF